MKQNNQINRQKASSHPFSGNGIFTGTVKSVVGGLPIVTVKDLGCTYNSVKFLGNTSAGVLKKGDSVLCTFSDMKTEELYVLGTFNKKNDVFTTILKFNALIDELESRLGLPSNALDSFKQT